MASGFMPPSLRQRGVDERADAGAGGPARLAALPQLMNERRVAGHLNAERRGRHIGGAQKQLDGVEDGVGVGIGAHGPSPNRTVPTMSSGVRLYHAALTGSHRLSPALNAIGETLLWWLKSRIDVRHNFSSPAIPGGGPAVWPMGGR